jgi:microcystin-dependent protein
MSDPFVGQITLLPYTFAPVNYHDCDGSLLSISDFEALFTLIGTTYGGDGQTTFGLPDLRGRTALHQGTISGTPFAIGHLVV